MTRYIFIIVILILFFLFNDIIAMMNKYNASYFEYGNTTILKFFNIDINGGLFHVDNTNTQIDGAFINIPPGSVDIKAKIFIGIINGNLFLISGKKSGVSLVFGSDVITNFKNRVAITLNYDPKINPKWIIGYEIDEKGRLHVIDTAGIDRIGKTVSFITYKPLILTWVYISNES